MTSHLRVGTASHCTTPSERPDQLIMVKVGCLHINPASTRGRRLYMLQMLALAFLPHATLILQNCSIMASLSGTFESALYLHNEVSTCLSVGDAVLGLQRERLLVVAYARRLTQRTVNRELEPGRLTMMMKSYKAMTAELLFYMSGRLKSSAFLLCRQLAAYQEFIQCTEELTLSLITSLMRPSAQDLRELATFQRHQAVGVDRLRSAIQFMETTGFSEVQNLKEVWEFFESHPYGVFKDAIEGSTGGDTGSYVEGAWSMLDRMQDIHEQFGLVIKAAVADEVWYCRRTLLIGVGILSLVLLGAPVLILLLKHTVSTMQSFTRSIEISTQRMLAEKQKSDLLLSRMLPGPVLRRLRAQKAVPAEFFEAVTIFFSDIVGFTNIASNSTPMDIINMLNMLYRLFDEKISHYNVYKVETIGDAYMVVSGCPQRNENHASEIADMSLSLMRSLEGARVPHRPTERLCVRAGLNTGPCVAGVVGATMPRYCLFGDTINTASRMESMGEAMKIHISCTTKVALDEIGGYEMESRGEIEVQGKGKMETYWLIGRTDGVIHSESPQGLRLIDYDQNFLELISG